MTSLRQIDHRRALLRRQVLLTKLATARRATKWTGAALPPSSTNAAGLGIMLALAHELGQPPLQVGVRFVVLSAGVSDLAGSRSRAG